MKHLPEGNGRTAGVAGMGRSGIAAARMLLSRGYTVRGFDSRENAEKPDHVFDLVKGSVPDESLSGLDLLVVSPGVPPSSEIFRKAAASGVEIIPEVELAQAAAEARFLGLTGSNGKTTTVEWLGHVLRGAPGYAGAQVAGNMGYALCDAVCDHPRCPVFAVELSSYQLETIQDFRVSCAGLLNLTPDHLARHGSMENYGAAKARILENQRPGDTAVFNADDQGIMSMRNMAAGSVLEFSLLNPVTRGAWLSAKNRLMAAFSGGVEEIIGADQLLIPGRHNAANALAVICMAHAAGVPNEYIARGLSTFKGVPHRIETLGIVRGIKWVNDSKSTNVDSLRVALESFSPGLILLAGGLEKESDYSVLRPLLEEKVRKAVLFGSGAEVLARAWKGSAELVSVEDLEQAVDSALSSAEPGDTVLLSPGCASFDQYRNFEERGDHFRKIVEELE